jgi:outer membrane protein assembly factor BamD (BamD/ComL family)
VGWTIQGQTSFEAGNFALAEKSYGGVLAMIDAKASERKSLEERLAAAIYQQGDAARKAGQTQLAADLFQRVVTAVPDSSIRMNAQYDAAASYIALKDWASAIRLLEDFRQRYPRSELQPEVNSKLALAYSETASWALAAVEFERVAAAAKDPLIARGAAWQAAELREKAAKTPADRQLAVQSWERYVKLYPAPLEAAVEARAKLLKFAQETGPASKVLALQKEILQVDQAGGNERTVRTRFLGATAALALAEPVFASYKQVLLVEPLQKQLKLKKARLEEVLKAYALAADYGVAEVVTAATYQTANLYQDFGKALLTSERPKKLGKAELEQYTVLLEEQAFPFEEKAADLHTLNAKRVREGLYDTWVQRSFAALKDLRPARFGKSERSVEVIDAIR